MGLFNSNKNRFRNYDYKFQRPSMFGGFSYFPSVIKILLISNVFIFLVQYFFLNNYHIGKVPLGNWFMYYFALMPIGEGFMPWQLLTYQFMHGGLMHLFFNMFALWMFGMELENLWGSKKFLIYYLACGVGAGLANLFIAPMIGPAMPTIGASGSVYGVLVAFGMLFPERPIFLYFLFPIRAKYFVLIYIAIEFLSLGGVSNVAHAAHLGGAAVGFFYVLLTRRGIDFSKYFKNIKTDKFQSQTKGNLYRNPYYDKYNRTDEYENTSDAEFSDINKKDDEVSQERIDEILDKISREGYQNLTEEEKKILFEASKKIH